MHINYLTCPCDGCILDREKYSPRTKEAHMCTTDCGDRCTLGCHAEAEEADDESCDNRYGPLCPDCGLCTDCGNCYCIDDTAVEDFQCWTDEEDFELGEACDITDCEACQ